MPSLRGIVPGALGLFVDTAFSTAFTVGGAFLVLALADYGFQPVLLCPGRIRLGVRRFTELALASLVVMSYGEVGPNVRASAMEMVSLPGVAS